MIKDLTLLVQYGVVKYEENEPYIKYGVGENAVNIKGKETVALYRQTVDYLWKSDKDIFDTITEKDIIDKLVPILMKNRNIELNADLINDIFSEIRSKPIQNYEVIYQLYGVEYYDERPLEIGPFTIYNLGIHRKILIEKYPQIEFAFKLTFNMDNPTLNKQAIVLIGVTERTRNKKRADEKGHIHLVQFEDTIRFILSDTSKRYDVAVFNFNYYQWSRGIIVSGEEAGTTDKMSGTVDNVRLHQFPINDPQYGYDKIWSILAKSDPNKMEQRIINAIEWVGKALRDEEPARAFTQYMFALEALLQFQQRGQLVSPSITYQISEFAAFIINDNLEDRLITEKTVKDLYAKRSAIAHGGSRQVNEKELYDAFSLLKYLITSILVNDQIKDFITIEQLSEWVKRQKYS